MQRAVIRISLFLLCAVIFSPSCSKKPVDRLFDDLGSFHQDVTAILKVVDSEEAATEASKGLQALIPRAKDLGIRWNEGLKNPDPNGASEKARDKLSEAFKAQSEVVKEINRLKVLPSIWPAVSEGLTPVSAGLGFFGYSLPE